MNVNVMTLTPVYNIWDARNMFAVGSFIYEVFKYIRIIIIIRSRHSWGDISRRFFEIKTKQNKNRLVCGQNKNTGAKGDSQEDSRAQDTIESALSVSHTRGWQISSFSVFHFDWIKFQSNFFMTRSDLSVCFLYTF